MKQVIGQQPFIGKVIGPPAPLSGRWSGVKGLPPLVVRTIADLAAGKPGLECLPHRVDPMLMLRREPNLIIYHTRAEQVYSKGSVRQEPATLSLFAAHLLLADKGGFPLAYTRLFARRSRRESSQWLSRHSLRCQRNVGLSPRSTTSTARAIRAARVSGRLASVIQPSTPFRRVAEYASKCSRQPSGLQPASSTAIPPSRRLRHRS
jgi:hypothetical protein